MTRPNIVCLSVDSIRADYCSFIDDTEHETTPFLDSLAPESTVYHSAIAPSIWTLPVHASIFTGLYPPEHGVLTGGETLGDRKTFAELLSADGYSTRAFHRCPWFETGDLLRGFETVPENTGFHDGKTTKQKVADRIEELSPRVRSVLERAYETERYAVESITELVETYREWSGPEPEELPKDTTGGRTIERAKAGLDETTEPFCWFLWLGEAHWRYKPPNPYHRSFTDRSTLGLVYNLWWQRRVYDSLTSRLKTTAGEITPPSREVTTFENLYRGCIEYCDALVEDLVTGLKEAGVWDDTVLIVFGDHGDGFGEDGVFGHHYSTDDSLINVPLLVRDPTGRLESGHVSAPVSLIDVYSTVLGLADVSGPESSSLDLAEKRREFAYTYYDVTDHKCYVTAPERGIDTADLPPAKQFAIWRSENEKVISYPERDEYVEVGDGDLPLRSRLDDHTESLREGNADDGEISDDVVERLKDMGYLRDDRV